MSKRAKRPEAPEGYVWTKLHLANGETVDALVSIADFNTKCVR